MTVKEMIEVCEALVKTGNGDLDVVAVCGSSGCSYSTSMSTYEGGVSVKRDYDNAGYLCDVDNGTKYISLYLD